MNKKEIFNLGRNKAFEFTGSSAANQVFKSRKSRDCDDEFSLHISTTVPVLENIKFRHNGCLLSRAVMNALIEAIQGKTMAEALCILENFRKFMEGLKVSELLPEKLLLFKKFSKFPSRHECIFLPCDIILEFIRRNC